MVGVWSAHSSQFIYVVALAILLSFGLPMLFVESSPIRHEFAQRIEPMDLVIASVVSTKA
jgi:hypothetical protein